MLGFIKNLQCVDDTGDETQDGEKDVDQEISTTSALEEDTERWEDDGKNDLEDIAAKKVSDALEDLFSQARRQVQVASIAPFSGIEAKNREHTWW
jgi:hypothetical protein